MTRKPRARKAKFRIVMHCDTPGCDYERITSTWPAGTWAATCPKCGGGSFSTTFTISNGPGEKLLTQSELNAAVALFAKQVVKELKLEAQRWGTEMPAHHAFLRLALKVENLVPDPDALAKHDAALLRDWESEPIDDKIGKLSVEKQKLEADNAALREALSECTERFKKCLLRTGSGGDEQIAELAVASYRKLIETKGKETE